MRLGSTQPCRPFVPIGQARDEAVVRITRPFERRASHAVRHVHTGVSCSHGVRHVYTRYIVRCVFGRVTGRRVVACGSARIERRPRVASCATRRGAAVSGPSADEALRSICATRPPRRFQPIPYIMQVTSCSLGGSGQAN